MNRKVKEIVDSIAEILQGWEAVDTVCLCELSDDDLLDPYFFLSLDVYTDGKIPHTHQRMEEFGFAGAFESSIGNKKDRFLVNNIPVRLEYKSIDAIEEIFAGVFEQNETFRESGTYMFYRIISSEVIFQSTDWLDQARAQLSNLPLQFWEVLRKDAQSKMEHYLGDLTASVLRNDAYFYLVSSAGFIKSACSVLFAINRVFEPSGRLLFENLLKLPVLPEAFRGRFDSFLRFSSDLSVEKKKELAELLAKSIISLEN